MRERESARARARESESARARERGSEGARESARARERASDREGIRIGVGHPTSRNLDNAKLVLSTDLKLNLNKTNFVLR